MVENKHKKLLDRTPENLPWKIALNCRNTG